jgi:hypothetical protein
LDLEKATSYPGWDETRLGTIAFCSNLFLTVDLTVSNRKDTKGNKSFIDFSSRLIPGLKAIPIDWGKNLLKDKSKLK